MNEIKVRWPLDHTPQNAVLYARISDSRNSEGERTTEGVDDQDKWLREFFGDRLGWGIRAVLIENDTSAFKRRKVRLPDGTTAQRVVRPEYRKAMGWLIGGTADGFGVIDLDRSMRDPRDLEDLIDLVEMTRVPVKAITGSLQLDNDSGITAARVSLAVANKSSRDSSRRQRRRRESRAADGRWAGGRRPFGFESDGVTLRPDEASELYNASVMTLQGISIYSQTQELNARGVLTSTGGKWTVPSLRETLKRARNAGLAVHNGEIVGDGQWPAIVPRDMWEAVHRKLSDPGRRTREAVPSSPKWLGTGSFLCGKDCGAPMKIGGYGASQIIDGQKVHLPGYRCSARSHLSRDATALDAYVSDVIVARFMRADAIKLITPPEVTVDVEGLRARAAVLRTTIKEMAQDRALNLITREEQLTGRDAANRELEEIDRTLAATFVDSPARPLVEAEPENVLQVWEDMAIGLQRAVVRSIMTVTVLPVKRRRRARGEFDEDGVEIVWEPTPVRKYGHPATSLFQYTGDTPPGPSEHSLPAGHPLLLTTT